jgi:hypothetical protein
LTGTGTVKIGGSVWNASGWMDCVSGNFELKAINPNADNCVSGYTDSFVYRGTAAIKCNEVNIQNGTGNWTSYCSGNIINTDLFEVVNCQSRRNHVASTNGLAPARSVTGFTLKIAPNPMSTSTVITYTLAKDGKVNIIIYNYMMQPIKVLVNNNVTKGTYSITWDGSSSTGNLVSSGIYKIVALVNGQQYTTSLQVLR